MLVRVITSELCMRERWHVSDCLSIEGNWKRKREGGEGGREGERKRETERDRDRETERDRDRDSERERESNTKRSIDLPALE